MITTNEARRALLSMDTATLEAFINEVDEYRRKYRWIPVEERLPPSNRKVLLYTERGGCFPGLLRPCTWVLEKHQDHYRDPLAVS